MMNDVEVGLFAYRHFVYTLPMKLSFPFMMHLEFIYRS